MPATGTASVVDAAAAADSAAATGPEDRVHAATAEARRDRAFIVSEVVLLEPKSTAPESQASGGGSAYRSSPENLTAKSSLPRQIGLVNLSKREKMMRPARARASCSFKNSTINLSPRSVIVVVKALKRRGEHSPSKSLAFESYCFAVRHLRWYLLSLSEEVEDTRHGSFHHLKKPSTSCARSRTFQANQTPA